MNFYNLASISHFSKKVVSMRERKFENLVEQKYDFSCGAAALTTILQYAYHIDVDELDVLKGLAKVSNEAVVKEKGFSLLDIRKYVHTLGLRGRGYRISADKLDEVKIPTIVRVNIRGYHHFVVLKRVVGDEVYIGDPALGNRVMNRDEFITGWSGSIFAVVGKGFDKRTVLSQPKKALTARKFLFGKAPVTNSDLLDYGFTHADLF
ncbi:MAG: C39 family peptidase [Gammaproteobacteria bacterium]|nr:C39 family peptidase [Gammaproteobacteria bacterium]MBQ0838901.1 C39 family peptidase [Gammaproteobacteria bacterium]